MHLALNAQLDRTVHRVASCSARYISFILKEIYYINIYFKIMFIRLAIFFGSLAVLLSTTTINAYIAVPSLFIVYQLLGGWKLSKLFYYTFFRDLK